MREGAQPRMQQPALWPRMGPGSAALGPLVGLEQRGLQDVEPSALRPDGPRQTQTAGHLAGL